MDFANQCDIIEYMDGDVIGFSKDFGNRKLLLAIVPIDQIEYVVNILDKDF